jgi:hypothetical protein
MNPSSSHEAVFAQQLREKTTELTRCTAWIQKQKSR